MLRITIQESLETLTFRVEGKLVGQVAKELEQSWNEVAPVRGHRAAIVDLTDTLFIDQEGRRILARLFHEGAFFRTSGPMTQSIVSEITGKSKPAWRGILAQSVLLLLIAMGARAAQTAPLRLTLRDAVEMALKQNPQVQIANLKTAVTQENQIVARSALLPQANLWLFHRRRTSGARAEELTVREQDVDPPQPIELADSSEFFHTPVFSADKTMERAFVERPEMKALASQIRAAELGRKAARDARVPRLALNGQWSEEGLSPASAIPAYLRNQIAQEVKTATAQPEAAKSEVDVANLGVGLVREDLAHATEQMQSL
jgi:hypothetical protein